MIFAKYIKQLTRTSLLGGLLAAVALTGCDDKDYDDSDIVPEPTSIAQIVSADSSFNLLRVALERANLASTFSSGGPFTVFAPTNSAFEAAGLNQAAISSLDAATLTAVLQYHVLSGAVRSTDIQNGINTATNTLNGGAFVSKFEYGTTTDGNNVNYGVSVNGARVTRPDIIATNGVIHVVDAVIVPPSQNLLTLVAADTSFSLLRTAVEKAGIGAALSGTGDPITVFAPNNAAFRTTFNKRENERTRDRSNAEVEAEILNTLTPEQLSAVLTYHVVPGRVFSTNFTPTFINTPGAIPVPGDVTTLSGAKFQVSSDVKLTGTNSGQAASIVRPNILATNGVVHVINRVLLP